MLKLRNPWGQKNSFNGRWSSISQEWDKINNELKQSISFMKQEDGQFFISLDDFVLYFDILVIVHVDLTGIVEGVEDKINWRCQQYFGELISSFKSIENENVSSPHYEFKVPDNKTNSKTYVIVSLIQKKIAKRRCETDGTFENSLEAIGFKIFSPYLTKNPNKYLLNSNFTQINGTKKFMYRKEVSKRMEFSPGIFKIVPCSFKSDALIEYVLRIYIEKHNSRFNGDNNRSKTCNLL